MTDVNEHDGGERDDDVVAAEYVLGVLPDANARTLRAASRKTGLSPCACAAWEERFSGMNDAFGEERSAVGCLRQDRGSALRC
jgi:anti-sigma-K factor RskA